MRVFLLALFLPFFSFTIQGQSQQISAPEPQPATINGFVTDPDLGAIPGATVSVDSVAPAAVAPGAVDSAAVAPASSTSAGPEPARQSEAARHAETKTSGDGSFSIGRLSPALTYIVTIEAPNFAKWTSPAITLRPGERRDLSNVKLAISVVQTSVSAVSPEELAVEQVQGEEQQRILGIIPNFYVVYDKQFVPLSSRLKYRLAFRAATDVVSVAGAAFIASVTWAAASQPDYRRQGIPGYGERLGAAYAGSVADVMIGGAILPSLLHQDPRYFYQGTGSHKSRALHAFSAPFIARGDNGKRQFNYSSVGGDLATGALENVYFPPSDRGPGIVFTGAALTTAGRIANAMVQEFILSKYTTHPKPKP